MDLGLQVVLRARAASESEAPATRWRLVQLLPRVIVRTGRTALLCEQRWSSALEERPSSRSSSLEEQSLIVSNRKVDHLPMLQEFHKCTDVLSTAKA